MSCLCDKFYFLHSGFLYKAEKCSFLKENMIKVGNHYGTHRRKCDLEKIHIKFDFETSGRFFKSWKYVFVK